MLCPYPRLVRAPLGVAEPAFGSATDTWLRTLRFRRVRELARERAGEFASILPGEGSVAMWDIDAEVWSSEVEGS